MSNRETKQQKKDREIAELSLTLPGNCFKGDAIRVWEYMERSKTAAMLEMLERIENAAIDGDEGDHMHDELLTIRNELTELNPGEMK